MAIEVEQKFTTTTQGGSCTKVLQDLGFVSVRQKPVVMTDWYFDDDNFSLLRRDRWLRHRALLVSAVDDDPHEEPVETSGVETTTTTVTTTALPGQWQLKVGSGSGSGSLTTVYTEIEGCEAIEEALSKLDGFNDNVPKLLEPVPDDNPLSVVGANEERAPVYIPNSRLTPFARIGTFRSSWTRPDELFRNINIDLDSTDFGYAVGEVEITVADESLVEQARERVQEVIQAISGPDKQREENNGEARILPSSTTTRCVPNLS
jgi:adenylate cyclase class IV